jgi:alkanesulfonate monooxygenase SsuD/methylene tetrahydromethanopterin reductase-like flavin-dependent oxidoreductase (luciferase family)
MRFGLQMESTGLGGDPSLFAEIARDAEAAGWDGIFLSDPGYPTVGSGRTREICDVWIALAAMAQTTERIRIGTLITPLPRYHPYEVAMRSSSLDHLSKGRMELTVGVGHGRAFERLGLDVTARVSKLRESLEVVTRLWTGEPTTFHGAHFTLDDAVLTPPPMQRPRIPLRICAWNNGSSIDLASKWGGLHLPHYHPDASCEEHGCADRVAGLRRRLGTDAELAIEGIHGNPDVPADVCRRFADAGASWWLEAVFSFQMPDVDLDGLRARIRKGPPR